jgi:hypothetical protein
MGRGFLYLVAIMDWFSRKVSGVEAIETLWMPTSASQRLEEAIARFGKPDIFSSDQGSQFTSFAFTNCWIGNYNTIGPTRSSTAGHPTRSMLRRQTRRNGGVIKPRSHLSQTAICPAKRDHLSCVTRR